MDTTSVSFIHLCVYDKFVDANTVLCSTKTLFSSSRLFVLVALDFQLQNITIIQYTNKVVLAVS